MRRSTKVVLSLAAVFLVIAAITVMNRADNGGGQAVSRVEHQTPPVRTTILERRSIHETVEKTGVAEARYDVTLTAEVAGRVVAIRRDLGDACKKGEVLVDLDHEPYDIALLDAKSAFAQAEAARSQAERALTRARALREKALASEEQMDRAEAAATGARAQQSRAEAAVALASRNLREASIRCPFDGVVAARQVDLGQMVGPQTPIARVVDVGVLEIPIRVSADELSRLRPGLPAQIHARAQDTNTLRGQVTRLGVAADEATRTYPVEVELVAGDDGPRAGEVVTVVVEVAEHEDAIAVPADAVRWESEVPHVFKVVDGTVAWTEVTLGPRIGGVHVVEAGLAPGDEVVVGGGEALADGKPVAVVGRADLGP